MTTLAELLPGVNATLNALSGALALAGFVAIRRGRRDVHKRFMLAAVGASVLFLAGYLLRVALTGVHRFPGQGLLRTTYLAVLGSHTLLAMVAAPLVIVTLFLALRQRFGVHRKVARATLPVWLYVSVTGVAVYVLLYRVAGVTEHSARARSGAAPLPKRYHPAMAGPCASVCVREPLDGAAMAGVRGEIARVASSVVGDDFWVQDRPFLLSVEPEAELEEIIESGLPEALGWTPHQALTLCAMCNEAVDHRLLAELCIRFARRLDGIVDLGGSVLPGPWEANPGSCALRVEAPCGLEGLLVVRWYVTANNECATTQYADPAFLESWLRDPRFHMVK